MAIDTPLKRWLADNLPTEKPQRMSESNWAMLCRLAAGEDMRLIGLDAGLTTGAVNSRLRQAASRIGYPGAATRAWLNPDGELASHAVERDPTTGCWLWTGKLRPEDAGPFAQLPAQIRPASYTTTHPPQRPVRQVFYERDHGPVTRGMTVVPTCGYRRCVNPAHAAVRAKNPGIGEDARRSVLDRIDSETAEEAAERVGISLRHAIQLRGKQAPSRLGRPSDLQQWLRDHLPEERPSAVLDLDWDYARRVVRGETLQRVADAEGVSRQMVHFRVRRAILTLRTLGTQVRFRARP